MEAVCRVCADREKRALRFNLMRQVTMPDGRKTTRGSGGTFLCQTCWKELIRGSRRRGGSAPK